MKEINKLSQIITGTKNSFLNILLNWEKIAGVSNCEIMIPYDLKKGTLFIAVPNGMVAKTAVRFKDQIIENINSNLHKSLVIDIKFSVDISRFNEIQKKIPLIPAEKVTISKTNTAKKAKELEKQGISRSLTETLAEIELLWEKNREN